MSDWETYFLSSENAQQNSAGQSFPHFSDPHTKRAQMMKNESEPAEAREEKKLKLEQKMKRIVNSIAGRAFNQTDSSQSGKTVIKSARSCTSAARQETQETVVVTQHSCCDDDEINFFTPTVGESSYFRRIFLHSRVTSAMLYVFHKISFLSSREEFCC